MKMHNSLKICVLGHGRHGKDTLAEIYNEQFGMTFQSSSMKAAEIFIFDELKNKYNYKTFQDCYNDRSNHRAEWHDLICDYNKDDKAKLAKDILKDADCYVGMRSGVEIEECVKQKLFDLIIWVDASKRLPLEPADSFNIDKSYADIIIDNNGTLEEFTRRATNLGKILFPEPKVIQLGEEPFWDKETY